MKKIILVIVICTILIVLLIASFLVGALLQYTACENVIYDKNYSLMDDLTEKLEIINFPSGSYPEVYLINCLSDTEESLKAKIVLPGKYEKTDTDPIINQLDEWFGYDDEYIAADEGLLFDIVRMTESIPGRIGSKIIREYEWQASEPGIYHNYYYLSIVQKGTERYVHVYATFYDN